MNSYPTPTSTRISGFLENLGVILLIVLVFSPLLLAMSFFQPVVTMIFVLLGTVYACRTKKYGICVLTGIAIYCLAWVVNQNIPYLAAAIASSGVALWFLGFLGSLSAKKSISAG